LGGPERKAVGQAFQANGPIVRPETLTAQFFPLLFDPGTVF
jgi:hypothetical protein